jgi:hypothetical protein
LNSAQSSLVAFAQGFEFNAGIFTLLQHLLGRAGTMVLLAVLGAGFALHLLIRLKRDDNQRWTVAILLFAAFVLLSPTINPWYWLWIMPFCIFAGPQNRPLVLWIALVSFLLLLSYGHGLILDGQLSWLGEPADIPYALPKRLQVFEHVMIALLGIAICTIAKMRSNAADKICHNRI